MCNIIQHTKTHEAIIFSHEVSLLLLQTAFIVVVLEIIERKLMDRTALMFHEILMWV